ncbi:peptidoglycan DD-metalloendopeptidase family protein [Shewanella sp. C32]|uniref:Peptidoglycan DD-metalloendopeptidase family protein n=1 Tax=Shewanella electrica TaxID=515560 RepID=A0ABT2FMW1_9GAMM|nr:peptidoglycan DD-metalloendopeptidase family protein [Shewanella electrica]MCH1926032.1 peptidoglycan DD-metalloendopeptidase family protein [Shewanella electrica]MCS4557361.1 peptidoglycan DD-metalloendopeptidase family protein [Shewanella electrica]
MKASIIAGFLILSSPLAQASDLNKRQSELQAIRQQIASEQQDLHSSSQQRDKLLQLLKRDERAIGDAAKKLNQTENQLSDSQATMKKLNSQEADLTKQQAAQQQVLAKQLKSAYLAGNHDYSKMLLNQQDPATVERLLTYYQYLNKARISAIDTLKQTHDELVKVQQQAKQENERLNALAIDQRAQSKQLSAEQNQRQNTLAQLQQVIDKKASGLEQLQIEEASLKRVIEQALKAAAENPTMDGLAKSSGKLNWPTKGSIRNSFGSARSGNVRWKGVVIDAAEGQAVKAPASGKVIYADWLKGFGLLMVIDHGQGFMSLYGYSQALLKEVGDTVKTGEDIALVGRSGGQNQAGLYFEIRHKGEAENPAKYCR